VDWLQPAEISAFVSDLSKTIKHVGWYFDLPANGERIIRDVSILNHKLIYTTSIPSDSPCESGGISNYFAVDVCTGGRTLTPFFDINNNGVIDGDDYINAGTEANPIWVAPSSIQVEGLAPQPTPVEVDNGMDRLFFPDDGVLPPSGGSFIEGYGKSIQFWHELDWK
jgi:type IV pilus assembly protein PilY1